MSTEESAMEITDVDPEGGGTTEFQCPFCKRRYDHEWVARVHITRADDEAHENHDGLMPETAVEVVSGDDVIATTTRSPDEIEVTSVSPDDLPDHLSTEQKRIVLTTLSNPHVDAYTELHELVRSVFEERDLGSVSYNTVRRTVQNFFQPSEEASGPSAVEWYDGLTDKQQRVIDAYLANPSGSYAEIAAEAGTSRSYPAQILNRNKDRVAELERKRDQLGSRTESDESGSGSDTSRSTWSESASDTTTDKGSTEHAAESPADGPITSSTARVMTASPYDEPADSSGTTTQADPRSPEPTTVDEETAGADGIGGPGAERDDDESATEVESDTADPAETAQALRQEIEQVRDRVAFLRRVAEQQLEAGQSSPAVAGQLAVASEIEIELDQILAARDE